MRPANRPRWQQVTALVSLSAGGVITGFSFVPRAAADLASPTGMPIQLLALQQSAQSAPADDAMLRSAIVNVADYYLRMAKDRTPADMEAIIWQNDSIDGVDHGASCAAFASLTLEMAAQVVGKQSWVTGGTSYPWPLHKWADVRVDPNPASLGVISLRQDATAHHRWHPLGDGYAPMPGDWVLFKGHVEVVRKYVGGVLHAVGGDSLPNFSVNAHEYRDPLAAQGVVGFVNNGELPGAANTTAGTANTTAGRASKTPGSSEHAPGGRRAREHAATGQAAIPGASAARSAKPARQGRSGDAAIPATPVSGPGFGKDAKPARHQPQGHQLQRRQDQRRRDRTTGGREAATRGTAAIPGLTLTAHRQSAGSKTPSTPHYSRHHPSLAAVPLHDASAQQAFIGEIAPGAVAAQRRYGVPAAVTIAQAIDESGWGRSSLATQDHNLFGIKGTGPAGRDPQPTREYKNGKAVTRSASFRVYHNAAESIDDHGKLLATSQYYRQAMADRQDPNAFAAALTGVYATDPDYGAKLIGLMRRYDLYRYDIGTPVGPSPAATPGRTTVPRQRHTAPATPASTSPPAPSSPAPTPPAPTPPTPSPPTPSPSQTPGPGSRSAAYRPRSDAMPSVQTVAARRLPAAASIRPPKIAPGNARARTSRYQNCIPASVLNAFTTMAKVPLIRAEPLYRDVAGHTGIRWELLAACDWMQCQAQPRYSPVHGEKLGAVNPDGTIYRTKSAALQQCAEDLVTLARAVYGIDLTAPGDLSVRQLANVFAAFRWGGLLRLHHTSAMEFPYSVAGLTVQHINMRWPNIAEPNTPDKPGRRFRMPFGAVPIVLGLHYPATV